MCYICNRYLFIIYSANRAHEPEAVHPDIFPGVAAFLFCSGFGGVERGESTGAGADNRSI